MGIRQERPVSRILSQVLADPCAVIPLGAALPHALISDLPGGSGHCMEQTCEDFSPPECHARVALPYRAGTCREPDSGPAAPSLFGLAPCGVYPARCITAAAVRSYRTFSPLPLRGADLWTSPRAAPGRPSKEGVALAVSFLWHWPSTGLQARVPDVIRHTALRSSDFPPPERLRAPAATARSSCQPLV